MRFPCCFEPTRSLAFVLSTIILLAPGATAQRRRGATPTPGRGAAAPAPAPRPQEAETTFEAMLSDDAFAVYGEVRAVGQLIRSGDVKDLLEVLHLLGDSPKELTALLEFVNLQSEALNGATLAFAGLPARQGLPESVMSVRLPSVEAARAFEPTLRVFLASTQLYGAPPAAAAEKGGRGARRERAAGKAQQERPPRLALRRAGNVIIFSDAPLPDRQLRPEGTDPLTDDARYQEVRGRFASDPLFIYFNVELMNQATRVQQEKNKAQAATTKMTTTRPVVVEPDARRVESVPRVAGEQAIVQEQTEAAPPAPATATSGEMDVRREPGVIDPNVEGAPPPAQETEGEAPQANMSLMIGPMVLGGLFSGAPQMPAVVGGGLNLDGDSLVLRVLLVNPPEAQARIIPFIPQLISGPAITFESAAHMPADTEIFLSASLDTQAIFEAVLAQMGLLYGPVNEGAGGVGTAAGPNRGDHRGGPPRFDEARLRAFEEKFGYRIREDLLATLGNEVAVSLPPDWFRGPMPGGRRVVDEEKNLILMIALRDPAKLRAILPRVLASFGLPIPAAALRPEKVGEAEIINSPLGSIAFLNNYLAFSPAAATLRGLATSYSEGQTLAATDAFRSSTSWEPRQKLAQGYLSRTLLERLIAEAKSWNEQAEPQTRHILTQLNLQPAPTTYAVSGEGAGGVLHELRLPQSLIKLFAAQAAVSARQSPLAGNEAVAIYLLTSIAGAQERHRKEKGRYLTIDELKTGGGVSEELFERGEYRIEVSVSGDKFEATATPTEYGKTGRRSFFIDETGVLRGADHGGGRASASDKPIN